MDARAWRNVDADDAAIAVRAVALATHSARVTVRSMMSSRQCDGLFFHFALFFVPLQTRRRGITSNRKVIARVTCPSFVSTPRIF